MFDRLKGEKTRKLSTALKEDLSGKWVTSNFKAEMIYKSYAGVGDCKVCGKGPAAWPESQGTNNSFQCHICYQDRNIIGNNIPKCQAIAFGKTEDCGHLSDEHIVLFHKESKEPIYFARLLKNISVENIENYYLIYDLEKRSSRTNEGKFINRYIANYVPSENGSILTFEEIAQPEPLMPDINDNRQHFLSKGMLGVLKADVDNLGLLLNKGFEYEKFADHDVSTLDRKTISRFLTFSRMLELFFSGWIKEALSSENRQPLLDDLMRYDEIEKNAWKNYLAGSAGDFSKIYTVYSGGDDLVLIGPWQTMIIFSILLNSRFRAYTCNNPDVTLSAGLAFVKPRFPVAEAINLADTYLQRSKSSGKNSITLFGRTIPWKRMPKMIDWFLFFDANIQNDNSRLKTSFLYNLIKYHHMALEYIDQQKVAGLRYASQLSYDIGRNIIETDKNGNIIKGKNIVERLKPLLQDKPGKESLIADICIPVSWALYRYREQSK